MPVPILISLAGILYLTATVIQARRILNGAQAESPPRKAVLVIGAIAIALHFWVLGKTLIVDGGLVLGYFEVLSLAAASISLVLVIGSLRNPFDNLAMLVFPATAVFLGLAFLFADPAARVLHYSWQLKSHILFSLLAYSLIAVAALQALLLAYQENRLRHRAVGGLLGVLPPLATMESGLFQLIGTGFALLSLSLFSGLIFVEDLFAQHLAHKTILSILAWIVFAVLLFGRWRFGWRGTLATRLTLAGFAVLLLAYFGSKLVLEELLGRYWG